MNNQHGGSRPAKRKDDGRLRKEPGYAKAVKMRFESKAEEDLINTITPRERVLALIRFINHGG